MINSALYKEIADTLALAQDRGPLMISYLSQMHDDISASEIREDDINRGRYVDSLAKTYDCINHEHALYTKEMSDMVLALQKHVNDSYGSVNNFLSDNGIQVRSTFALLSSYVGYPINSENIESIS